MSNTEAVAQSLCLVHAHARDEYRGKKRICPPRFSRVRLDFFLFRSFVIGTKPNKEREMEKERTKMGILLFFKSEQRRFRVTLWE